MLVYWLGWNMMLASTSSKAPARIKWTLPPELSTVDSSAGVPRIRTVPGSASATVLSARPAPTADGPIRLWPQPWPMFGSASNSARIATVGRRPPPMRARQAVASPAIPTSDSISPSASRPVSVLTAVCSWWPSSGLRPIVWAASQSC